jgi:hypothetical protein
MARTQRCHNQLTAFLMDVFTDICVVVCFLDGKGCPRFPLIKPRGRPNTADVCTLDFGTLFIGGNP